MEMHLGQSKKLEMHTATVSGQWNQLVKLATAWWSDAIALRTVSGFRNSQVTVITPTGAIGFLMDYATTGVEPMLGVVTHKKLVGGGFMSANATVPVVLRNLGYDQNEIDAIIAYIDERGTIKGAPALKQQDIAVFDGAFTPANGVRSISWEGHLRRIGTVAGISPPVAETVVFATLCRLLTRKSIVISALASLAYIKFPFLR